MIRFLMFFAVFLFSFFTKAQSVIIGRTTGTLPHLEYGLGADRLGGAKMTYLDTNVLIRVVDSIEDKYKVALTNSRHAYLPKRFFKADNEIKPKPFYLTGSWMVRGDEQYDYVSISLDERLPYKTEQQINPSRIVVDIFGATSNTNWITQRLTVKEVKNVWYEQIDNDVFRVNIDLSHEQHWGYSIYYEGKRLTIRIKHQPASLKLKNLKIAIDAGHGGENIGATGITSKIKEKDYTLLFAKQLEQALRCQKVKTFMTREKDTSLSMNERMLMIKKEDPDFLISIHLNSSSKDSIKGVSTYYRHIGFRPLTQFILTEMLKLKLDNFGNIGSFNFTLNAPTDYPNCLVEVAFLSNKEDEQHIMNPKFHKEVATQITKGIKNWLKSMR